MFARRRLATAFSSSVGAFGRQAGAQASLGDAGQASIQQAPAASALSQWAQRCMSTGMWDVGCTQQRQELCLELSTARSLLPNRSNFFPQFTPHGVQLLPHRLPSGVASMLAAAADDEEADDEAGAEVLADSVKRKRKLKMKKHKYKKRMKRTRLQA